MLHYLSVNNLIFQIMNSKMVFFHKLILLFILFLPYKLILASTANWIYVVDKGGSSVFYDKYSIIKTNDILSVRWTSNSIKGHRLRVGSTYINKKSVLYSSKFNCKEKSFIVDRAIWFDSEFAVGQGHLAGSTGMGWQNPDSRHYEKNLHVEILKILC